MVILQVAASARLARAGEVTCQVDGCHFRLPEGQPGDRAGGTDSDLCPHDCRGRTLPYILVVCPRCNFAALHVDFASELTDEQRRLLLRALATSRYRGVTDSVAEIPGWERFRLAAKCAALLGREKEEVNCLRCAAWSARIEACRAATVAYSSRERMIAPVGRQVSAWQATRGVADVIGEIEEKIAEAKKPAEKARLTLHLAMMCQRGGFAARRDKVIARLKRSVGSDRVLAARVRRFTELVAVETECQKELVTLLARRLEKETSRPARTTLTYLLADTLRRLGRDAEAVRKYRGARRLMSEPGELRLYTDHFLSMLAPGEPLPLPEPEDKPKSEDVLGEPNPTPAEPSKNPTPKD